MFGVNVFGGRDGDDVVQNVRELVLERWIVYISAMTRVMSNISYIPNCVHAKKITFRCFFFVSLPVCVLSL